MPVCLVLKHMLIPRTACGLVDIYVHWMFVLKPRYAALVAMAEMLTDALVMVAATGSMSIFTDKDDKECKLVVDALKGIDVESCEDFRLAFVLTTRWTRTP